MSFDDTAPVGDDQDQPAGTPDLQQHQDLLRWAESPNIAEELEDTLLGEIGDRVKREYDIDETSRSDWKTMTQKAMDLALQVAKEKQYPWPRAANVIYPIMTTAAMQFAARAYPAIVSGRAVVRGIVVGTDNGTPMIDPQTQQPAMNPQTGQPQWLKPPGYKRQQATRIGEHMSWQLLDEMTEWDMETDQLLHILPITGTVFRKSYFDPGLGRNMSVMVTPMDLAVNYHAKSMETAPRITEIVRLYPREITELERAGLFLEIQYSATPDQANDEDAPQVFLEQHRYWDLDEDDYPEPYIVTIHKETSQVVRIRARYDAESVHFSHKDHKVARIEAIQYYTKYDFIPNPDGGIYSLGFGKLLGPINEAVNTTLNMLLDSGHLSVTGGGFIGKGLSVNAGAMRFTPGEYKMVNVIGGAIKDNIVPLQFPGPSTVLFQLLGLLIEAGKDIAAVKDVLSGEQQQHNVPATTTLALIEQGLKVFTGIYKRVHRSLKSELNKLYRLNFIYLAQDAAYRNGDEWKSITREDYKSGSGVEPISDPSMVSDTQKMARGQVLMSLKDDPLMNGVEIRKRFLDSAQIENPDQLFNPHPQPPPQVLAKAAELHIRAQREKAAELKDLAQAILFFAQADKAVGDNHLAWVGQQLDAWKSHFEASSATVAGGEGSGEQPHPAAPPPPTGGPPMASMDHPGAPQAPPIPNQGNQ